VPRLHPDTDARNILNIAVRSSTSRRSCHASGRPCRDACRSTR